METGEILKYVDHTALKAFCTWTDIRNRLWDGICMRTAVLHSENS